MPVLLLLLSILCPQRGSAQVPGVDDHGSRGVEWIEVAGEVELDRVAALASAERRAIEVLWERFGPRWRDRAGRLVPQAEVTAQLERWIERDFTGLPVVAPLEPERFESSVGTAWRSRFRLQVAGPGADRFLARGEFQAGLVTSRYHRAYLLILGLAGFLLWLGHRLDRATRGYLSWRIRLGTLFLTLSGAWLLYPHV